MVSTIYSTLSNSGTERHCGCARCTNRNNFCCVESWVTTATEGGGVDLLGLSSPGDQCLIDTEVMVGCTLLHTLQLILSGHAQLAGSQSLVFEY